MTLYIVGGVVFLIVFLFSVWLILRPSYRPEGDYPRYGDGLDNIKHRREQAGVVIDTRTGKKR